MRENMKKKTLLTVILAIILASCAPAPSTPLPITNVSPTSTPSPTVIPRPTAKIKESTTLYAGAGNVDFETVAQLPAQTEIYPLGIYGDFIKAEVTGTGQNGFVFKDVVEYDSSSLSQLKIIDLQWVEKKLVKDDFPLKFEYPSNFGEDRDDWFGIPVAGSWLNADDDVRIRASLSFENLTGDPNNISSGLLFQNSPEDQRYRSLDIFYGKGAWSFGYWNEGKFDFFGKRINSANSRDIEIEMTIYKGGKDIDITIINGDNKLQKFSLQDPIYSATRRMYIGLQVGRGNQVTLHSLSILTPPSGKYAQISQIPSLKDLAEQNGIAIGTISSYGDKGVNDPIYWNTIRNNYNLLYIGWFDPKTINQWGLGFSDSYISFAKTNKMTMHGDHLLWREYVPDELKTGNHSPEDVEKVMKERIQSLMTRFPQIQQWNVVNEVTGTDGQMYDYWYQHLGQGYIETAFRYAHEVNPNATLIWNEDWVEEINPESTAVYNTIKQMLEKGVPINGIGFQMHLRARMPLDKEKVKANLKRFADLGLKIYITEIDVNIYGLSGTQEEKFTKQANIYRDMLEACLDSGRCGGMTMWGFSDKESWCYTDDYKKWFGSCESPLIFDENYQPKPAYFAIYDLLQQRLQGLPVTPKP
jgi:endo-1,4-beta-xylanase